MDRWLALFLGLFLVAPGAWPAWAETFTVGSKADSPDANPGDGKCESKAGGCTLRAAIEEANATTLSDSVRIPDGTYTLAIKGGGPDFAQTGVLFLSGEIEISGIGQTLTVIDGGAIDRVFQTEADSSVRISDLTIQNGLANGANGGGILNRGHLKLENVRLSANRSRTDPLNANGRGGALVNSEGADVSLLNVLMEGNAADGAGGAMVNLGTAHVMNSTLRGNESLTDAGGAIRNEGTLSVVISTLHANRAQYAGGIDNVKGKVDIVDTTLDANKAASDGGALRNSGEASLVNCTISGGMAGSSGGAIWNLDDGTVTLNNVTVTANQAGAKKQGDGGGGIASQSSATVRMANTIIAGNRAGAGRGHDCSGVIVSQGYNLIQKSAGCTISGDRTGNVIDQDAKLATLASNGGPTETHALLPGSPAIDGGNPAKPTGKDGSCAAADQRGVPRPASGSTGGKAVCDIGAFELAPATASGGK